MSTKIEKRGVYLFIDGKEIKNDIKSIEKEFFKARGELKKMEVGSAEYNKQMQKVGQLKSMMDVHNKTIRDTAKQWNKNTDAAEKNNGVMSKLLTSAKGLLPAFGWGAVIAGAVKGAKALFNMYVETAKARREVEKLTGLSGKPLADFTARVQATADTFNRDFNEVLVGVNSFAQTMGISLDEALAKVNDGFLTGADNSGEFLDIIKEYGPQLKAAGLSADESIALRITSYNVCYTKLLRTNGGIAILFLILSLFWDIVFEKVGFFPFLFLFGAYGTGKTSMTEYLLRVFGGA